MTYSVCKKFILFIILSVVYLNSYAQDSTLRVQNNDTAASPNDTLTDEQKHSPKKAVLYSVLVPGLGQAYNKKYWKIPIVYAALGTSSYFIYYNYQYFDSLRNAYLIRTDGDSTTIDEFVGYSEEAILQEIDRWRGYLDIAVFVTAGIYLFNIIDALVDAHLFYFDVSDDLSFQIKPTIFPSYNYAANSSMKSFGLNVKLYLK